MERDQSEQEAFLSERYGKHHRKSLRWQIPAAILALVALPWLIWSAGYHSQPTIRHELIAFKVIDPSSIEITFLVERSKPDIEVVCTLVARDFEKNVVGEITEVFEANDAPARDVRTKVIPTRTRAVNADVIGCDQR